MAAIKGGSGGTLKRKIGGPVQISKLVSHAGRISPGDRPGRNGMRHDAPRSDQSPFPDHNARQERAVRPDGGFAFNDGSLEHLFRMTRFGKKVVCECHSRRNENVISEHAVLSDINVAVDLDAVADAAAVIDGGM